MSHQHPNAKPYRISLLRGKPFSDVGQKLLSVFLKHLRRHLVTGRPVIHIGQKHGKRLHTLCKILPLRNDKRVKLVFIKIHVRKNSQKFADFLPFRKLLRHLPKRGRAHADHRFFVDRRYQLRLKIPVSDVFLRGLRLSDLIRNAHLTHFCCLYLFPICVVIFMRGMICIILPSSKDY